MPVINRLADRADEIAEWRHDLHMHPELQYDVHRTAATVAEKLKSFGCNEIATGIGRTGVVGVIRGHKNSNGKVIGLRADMDALPIEERTGLPYASNTPGRMHACGHDGHTSMLLGAARHLCETRNFDGTAVVIFQPAEEGGAGAKAMIDDGLIDRFEIGEVFGLHNYPGLPVGNFAIRPGPLMASADRLWIEIEGVGGHAARPHKSVDTVLVGSSMVTALQQIVARNVDPIDNAVVSITLFQAGSADNVIPQNALLRGTVRTLRADTRDLIERRLKEVVDGVARLHGATAKVRYHRDYPIVVNHPEPTAFATEVARDVAGTEKVDAATLPVMGGEDFAFMLLERPGAFIFMGNGDTANLHHPKYDFNDKAIPFGASYWVRLIERAMPA
ncbi:MAG: M20 aminoacylase family protein [Xanthobacteraceae bacterium]